MLTPWNAFVAVEHSEDLGTNASWVQTTNFSALLGTTNIIDPADARVITQRFYRVKMYNP
jgi:hypothetical protein